MFKGSDSCIKKITQLWLEKGIGKREGKARGCFQQAGDDPTCTREAKKLQDTRELGWKGLVLNYRRAYEKASDGGGSPGFQHRQRLIPQFTA